MTDSPTFCRYFDASICRSCEWLGLGYAEQIQAKERKVQAALTEVFGDSQPFLLEATADSREQGFRNRAKMTVTGTLERPIVGLPGLERLDEGRELLSCPIHHPRLNELLAAMPAWISSAGLVPYRIQERHGELKGLILFYSPLSDQMYLRFVLRSRAAVSLIEKALPALQAQFKFLVCVSANLQPVPHALLEGPEEVMLTSQSEIEHQLGSLRLRLAPQAFVQTHAELATRLYQTAAHWVSQSGVGRMLELFCGQGAFSFFAASRVGTSLEILGFEINAQAVETAQRTARELGFDRLRFLCADASKVGEEARAFAPGLILVNPPRKGLGARGVELVLDAAPPHLIYSSCNVESLAEDLQRLSAEYPIVRRAQIFDLFPHTAHFETLVWLERLSS